MPARGLFCALLVCLSGLSGPAAAEPSARAGELPAPGYSPLGFAAPEPGSYRLPPLFEAVDAAALDQRGQATGLHALMGDRLVVLSFIYSACNDLNGCPLAVHVMRQAAERLATIEGLDAAVRFISFSFDPARDTPDALAGFARDLPGTGAPGEGFDWRFLTIAPATDLDALLESYGQTRIADGEAGQGGFSHLLRVYLIDRQRRVRNIYGVSFLHADTLVNDLRTLALAQAPATGPDPVAGIPTGPGDDRSGYGSDAYTTRSRTVQSGAGRPADLAGLLARPPLGLPPVPQPADNPATPERIALGRKLFFDRRLSYNGTLSCAMCHVPEQGFTSNELATAVGMEGRSVRRNSPTVFNIAYARSLFHDGREENLEQQVWGPLLAANEMGNPSIGSVLARVRGLADYRGLFEAAFDGRGPGMETLGMALAAYQRGLVSADSPFDRWFYAGRADAIDAAARRGFELFRGRAGCAGCHRVGESHALFTDDGFHNTGIGYRASMGPSSPTSRVLVAPGVYMDVDRAVIESVGEPPAPDLGRYEVTGDPDDRWKYRTPSLRNIALTAPYMHDGSLRTLEAVVDFYAAGGLANPLLDGAIRPFALNAAERADLVAFLQSLTGSNVAALVADALAAPVGDPGAQP